MSEEHLNAVLHGYADDLPQLPAWSAAEARRRARHERRRRRGAVLAGVAVVAGLTTTLLLSRPSPDRTRVGYSVDPAGQLRSTSTPRATVPEATVPEATVPARGAVADGPSYDCASGFSAKGLRHQQFVFAGTVTSIALTRTNQQQTAVTFRVDEWLRGGPVRTVAVLMQSPYAYPGAAAIGYQIGTRLLVAGDRAAGSYAAFGCGFTRYRTAADVHRWRTILRA